MIEFQGSGMGTWMQERCIRSGLTGVCNLSEHSVDKEQGREVSGKYMIGRR